MNLLQILVQKGILPEKDVAAVKEAQKSNPNKAIHTLLIEGGYVKEEEVLPILAEQFGMDLVDLTSIKIEPDTLKAMPSKLVHRRSLMPMSRENGTIVVATGDPVRCLRPG